MIGRNRKDDFGIHSHSLCTPYYSDLHTGGRFGDRARAVQAAAYGNRDICGKKQKWIEAQQKKCEERQSGRIEISREERVCGMEKAREVIARRTAYFADVMGVDYGRITIREQKTRWGSCSSAGNLNFNWKLILLPPEVLDYVVVHELAHRREMNHSENFWKIVEQVLPDYKECRKMLRKTYV